jgi:hypothetical protein
MPAAPGQTSLPGMEMKTGQAHASDAPKELNVPSLTGLGVI